MKVRPSVKPICEKCKVIKRNGKDSRDRVPVPNISYHQAEVINISQRLYGYLCISILRYLFNQCLCIYGISKEIKPEVEVNGTYCRNRLAKREAH